MPNKLSAILLIDDDDATQFLHKVILEDLDCCDMLYQVSTGMQALTLLQSEAFLESGHSERNIPELIFLDINMPGMNGWEFLEKFSEFDTSIKDTAFIVVLTSSSNPDDRSQADRHAYVRSFLQKPLTDEMVLECVKQCLDSRHKSD